MASRTRSRLSRGITTSTVAALLIATAAPPSDAVAQDSSQPTTDSAPAGDTTVARPMDPVLETRRSRLRLGSGKTYNRVEGLPVHFGPVFSDSGSKLHLTVELMGILRSADEFRWDGPNVGHRAGIELRRPVGRSPRLRLAAYDVVDAVEDWQMPRGESGVAAFLLRRDYRDHFGRHGGQIIGTLPLLGSGELAVGFARERWSSREVRSVLTVLRNNHTWRPNPAVDDGHARLFTLGWSLDTRNDVLHPSDGWLVRTDYEHGRARDLTLGETSPVARTDPSGRSNYGRLLLDLRKYNRISPGSQLNFRVVAGGWLHGDELPLQRRFSVGGPGTLPGFDFRAARPGVDVGTCSGRDAPPPAGMPAQCERVLLAQVEYRDELPFPPGTIFAGTPLRIRSAALTLRPVLVAFANAGRGWLVAPAGSAQNDILPVEEARELVYRRGTIPPLGTFRTDVGLGLDLGLFGIYVAKAVSHGSEPVNVILRAGSRF